MVRTGFTILIYFIVLKEKQMLAGGNLQPCMAAIFIYILKFCEDITGKKQH